MNCVEQLGTFVELEVVLHDEQTPEQGVQIADDLIALLGLQNAKRITQTYADLLARS